MNLLNLQCLQRMLVMFLMLYIGSIIAYADDFSNKITNDLFLYNATRPNVCKTGKEQSPINIQTFKTITSIPGLYTYYRHDFFYEIQTKYGVEVAAHLNSMQYIELLGKIYHFFKFSIDTPSNTEINNQSFPAEMDFFHIDGNGHMAILAVFIQEGDFNPVIQDFIVNAPRYKFFYFKKIYINLKKLLPSVITDYYLYNGSLLNAPCTEGVKWVVFTHPIYASAQQINSLKKMNSLKIRSIQSLGLRVVKHATNE